MLSLLLSVGILRSGLDCTPGGWLIVLGKGVLRMLIKEVCRVCGLTKKAVEYYEQRGFIKPQIMDNGYRNYSEQEIVVLKEISVLRKCGIGIKDIRTIMDSTDKSVALARYKRLNELKMQKLNMIRACIDGLIKSYDIEDSFHRLQGLDEECLTVQEKLILAFPGNYGLYLSFHFGRFLRKPVQTEEQRAAYDKIVAYLDNAAACIPDELNAYMEQAIRLSENVDMEKYENAINLLLEEAIGNPDAYFGHLKVGYMNVEEYIAYRTSEEFKQSPQGRMAELMSEFQKNSGYHDVFLANLMILSPAYREYSKRLEAANAAFIKKYPQAGVIYGAE